MRLVFNHLEMKKFFASKQKKRPDFTARPLPHLVTIDNGIHTAAKVIYFPI